MNRLFLLFFLLISFGSFSQKYTFMEVNIDSSGFCQNNILKLTVVLTKRNGKETTILPDDSRSKWGKLKISGNMVTGTDRGVVTYAQHTVHANNRVLTLRVTTEDGALKVEKSILLPYVKQLLVYNHEFLVNEPMPLRYNLLYSNGKTVAPEEGMFPLGNVASLNSEISLKANGEFCYAVNEPTTEQFKDWQLTDRRTGQILLEKRMQITYPLLYAYRADGINGFDGFSGQRSSGVSANGNNGQAGSNGTPAANVDVFIKQGVYGKDTILTFHTFAGAGQGELKFVKFTRNPVYSISACGGAGGRGGNGSDGQAGSIDTTKKVNSPDGGNGGHGGNGGFGGNGGKVTLYFSPEASYLKPFIAVVAYGGNGGEGGVGGKGGKGDHTNSKLLGTLFKVKNGMAGTTGQRGPTGQPGQVLDIFTTSAENWLQAYNTRRFGN